MDYQTDPTVFIATLKDSLKERARQSRDGGDATQLYSIVNSRYANIDQYIIEATCFEGALLKYCKLVKKEYSIDELSVLIEEMQESIDKSVPITLDMAAKWLRGKTTRPPSPWSESRNLKVVKKM